MNVRYAHFEFDSVQENGEKRAYNDYRPLIVNNKSAPKGCVKLIFQGDTKEVTVEAETLIKALQFCLQFNEVKT